MPHDPYGAMYVHIPFCKSRCAYCDFATEAIPNDSKVIDEYIESLVVDIRRQSKADELGSIKTIYIGGGTPSYIGLSRLSSLLYAISLSVITSRPDMEWSMEANPESVDERLIRDIWAMGVNRLSIGVQSFDDDVLSFLGRPHDAATAKKAVKTAQSRFTNISVDLMCGIPGQSDESFADSVKTAIELGVTHVSIYPLTIEEHTPFYRDVIAGRIPEPDDDVEARHMKIAQSILSEAGFGRYEVASYAKPGYECKHNIAYWTGVPYIGFGRSAATMTQNDERRMRMTDGVVTDDLSRPERESEDLMLGMRMTRGISHEQVEQAKLYLNGVDQAFAKLQDEGLVTRTDEGFAPTEKGWLCGNELYGELFYLPSKSVVTAREKCR